LRSAWFERPALEQRVPAQAEVGRVDLQHEARGDDRLVLGPHRLGERLEIGRVGGVVVVRLEQGDHPGRRRVHERLGGCFALGCGPRQR
jgi:hypothetical protein